MYFDHESHTNTHLLRSCCHPEGIQNEVMYD